MLQKTEALVLRSLKYGEQQLIVDMFTREHGRLSFIVSVSRSPRASAKKLYFQPLTLLYIETDVRPLQQLQKLRNVALMQPLQSLLSIPDKLAIGLFVAEFLTHALKGEQQNEPLFSYVCSSLQWLDGAPAHYANFHLVFLMRLSRFLGFYPNLEEGGVKSMEKGAKKDFHLFFDLRAATFCGSIPLHRDFLLPSEAANIALLMRMDYATMHLFHFSHQQRQRILEVLLLYYRLHLPDFPELRSLAVLQELYK